MSDRRQLAFLNAAHFACHYFLLIFPTAAIAIEREGPRDYGAALALGTPVYVCFALGTLPAGWLGDRFDGNRLIGLFFIGCGTAAIMVAVAPNDFWLMAGLGLLGLFAALYHPVGLAMVTKLSDRPGHALAVNGVFGNLGLAAAALSTGLLADAFGWRSAFLIPGVVAIAIALVHGRRSRRAAVAAPSNPTTGQTVTVPRSAQFRVVAIVLLAALFGGFVFNGVSISLPKLFDERLDAMSFGLSGIGGYSALVFAVAAFAQLPVGALLDRFGGRPVLLLLMACEVAALAITSQAGGAFVVPAALVTVTLMFAGIPITGWLLAKYVSQSWRARAFALEYVLALGVSAMIVPAMAVLHGSGVGFDWQYLLFALSAAFVVTAALAIPKQGAVRASLDKASVRS